MANPYRELPSIAKLLESQLLIEARQHYPHAIIADVLREEVARLRGRIAVGTLDSGQMEINAIAEKVLAQLALASVSRLRPVINATGIVLHTNLGRAPLHEDAARAAYEAARGYTNLELDLATGKRSSRQGIVREGIRSITGAESATAVNNCAAATVIVLRAVAAGKEVIVSRGQLIEIGGNFRIPDVMATSNAILREVGTTNITRLADYERAIGSDTAAIMRIHTSNFRVKGFTRSVELTQLVELGKKHNLAVIDDAGSGQAIDLTPFGLPGEPLVAAGVAAGADIVLFSGDKLLGGPQAGLIAGRSAIIQRIEKDPLMRAFRLDKMTLAALEATLSLYRDPSRSLREIPVLRMLTVPLANLMSRAELLATRLREIPHLEIAVREDRAFVGGGSFPEVPLCTAAIVLKPTRVGTTEFAAKLRIGSPAVLGRVKRGAVLVDLRCVFEHQEDDLVEAVGQAISRSDH